MSHTLTHVAERFGDAAVASHEWRYAWAVAEHCPMLCAAGSLGDCGGMGFFQLSVPVFVTSGRLGLHHDSDSASHHASARQILGLGSLPPLAGTSHRLPWDAQAQRLGLAVSRAGSLAGCR